MSKIILIMGPTASGKTNTSIHLAKKLNASIINADSTQIYKDVCIGVAKIRNEEKENIPHYMLDIVSLDEDYTVFDYQRDARKILNELISENKNIVIVGGSYLYVKALLYNYNFSDIKEEKKDYSNLSNENLKQKVDSIYKDNNIHLNNRKRLERFLSHYENTNEIIRNYSDKDKPLYDFAIIGLNAPREKLYEYINLRVDKMMDNGLIDEVKSLKKYSKISALIGYKEIISYLNKEIDLEKAKELIKQNTRKYAKRQYTFMNNQFNNINWFEVDYDNFNNTLNQIDKFLEI